MKYVKNMNIKRKVTHSITKKHIQTIKKFQHLLKNITIFLKQSKNLEKFKSFHLKLITTISFKTFHFIKITNLTSNISCYNENLSISFYFKLTKKLTRKESQIFHELPSAKRNSSFYYFFATIIGIV